MLEYSKKCKTNFNGRYEKIMRKRIDKNNINTEKSEELNLIEDIRLQKSLEFFKSEITFSNWYDEIKNNNALGLLMKIDSSGLTKLGIGKNLIIENISTNFMPILDMIDVLTKFFSNKSNFGDISYKNILFGTTIGNCNTVIPVYINKYHWKVAKKYIDSMLGITISHNPLCYTKNYQKYLLTIFAEMMYYTFKIEQINEKWMGYLITYLRTCAEICFENKHNRNNLVKYVDEFISNNKDFKTVYDYDNVISQTICTGYILDDNKISKLLNQIIKRVIVKISNDLKNNLNFKILEKKLEPILEVLMSYYKMNILMNKLLQKTNGYNNFIKLLEYNYGLLDDEILTYLVVEIKTNIHELPENVDLTNFYKMLNQDDKEISQFIKNILGI